MKLVERICIFIVRLVTVALWGLVGFAINEGILGGAVIVGVLSYLTYQETDWDWL